MAINSERLTETTDLKAVVRRRAVAQIADPDLWMEVDRAMADIMMDWDDLPNNGAFLARLVSLVVERAQGFDKY